MLYRMSGDIRVLSTNQGLNQESRTRSGLDSIKNKENTKKQIHNLEVRLN